MHLSSTDGPASDSDGAYGIGLRVGVDIGGTFTDAVAIDRTGKVYVGKAPTTIGRVADGVMASLADLAAHIPDCGSIEQLLATAEFIGHGTTVGTNALITRKGARVGLLITAGFEDTPFIQRAIGRLAGLTDEQLRRQVSLRQPKPLVARGDIVGVIERVDSEGKVLVPLEEAEAERAVAALLANHVEAVAICLLWSFRNPVHEQRLLACIRRLVPGLPVSMSSELVPKIRENARCNTVLIDAFIRGRVHDYLSDLHQRLEERGFDHSLATVQCFGGVADWRAASAISTIDSGPVGGVMASKHLAQALGEANVITTDVGGTSFDVGVIVNGQEPIAKEYFGSAGVFARFEVLLPRVDIQTTGAGGGTIARFDPASRSIKLGPDSAGASPGPVFYGQGGEEPTVADAWLVLGYLDPRNFLGGRIKVDLAAARSAIERRLAVPLGMSVTEAALAILELANNHMADAIKVFCTARGLDVREFALFAFGGGGPLHAAAYGRIAGAKRTYLLANAGVTSAFGISLADVKHRQEMSILWREPFDTAALARLFAELDNRLLAQFAGEGLGKGEVRRRLSLDMRYRGQIHEMSVTVPDSQWVVAATDADFRALFNRSYAAVYGDAALAQDAEVEIVGVCVEGVGEAARPELRFAADNTTASALLGNRAACFFAAEGFVETGVYAHQRLREGAIIEGPCFVQDDYLTMLVLPGQTARVDAFRNLVIENRRREVAS